jgi:hypothetical protein
LVGKVEERKEENVKMEGDWQKENGMGGGD